MTAHQDEEHLVGSSSPRPRLGGVLWIVLGVVAMTGCSGGGSGSGGPPGGQPDGQPTPSLQLSSQQPSPITAGGETYTGVLGSDTIEGGCTYLQTADGKRYEVIAPDGWQIRQGSAELVAPDGRVVARAGDTVTIRGAIAKDMVSICQIGPILQVVEVIVGG